MSFIYIETNKIIGENLTYYIDKTGISREKLSELSRVSLSTISEIENFRTSPSFDIICRLAGAMGISSGELGENRKYTDASIVGDAEVRFVKKLK